MTNTKLLARLDILPNKTMILLEAVATANSPDLHIYVETIDGEYLPECVASVLTIAEHNIPKGFKFFCKTKDALKELGSSKGSYRYTLATGFIEYQNAKWKRAEACVKNIREHRNAE